MRRKPTAGSCQRTSVRCCFEAEGAALPGGSDSQRRCGGYCCLADRRFVIGAGRASADGVRYVTASSSRGVIATVPPMSTGDWDERYAGSDAGLWSGRANGVLVAEMAESAPGRALDVGCGEGADAIWLALKGWSVTGLDVSKVALERAAAAAHEARMTVEWVCADVAATPANAGGYDLVSVLYPALKHSAGDEAVRALVNAVAPDGTLLIVGHAPLDAEYARAHGFEIADYVQPTDVRTRLDSAWEIEIDETRPRVDPMHDGSPYTHDAVLRARRRR